MRLILFLLSIVVLRAEIDFDGTDDVVACGSGASLDDMAAISISAWINTDTMGENSAGRIVDKTDASSPTAGWDFTMRGVVDRSIAFEVQHATTQLRKGTVINTITHGAQTHVCVTWDGTVNHSGVKIYVNGSEVSYVLEQNGSGSRSADAAHNLLIGNTTAGDRTFDGRIGEVAIWNAVLSSDEITLLYKSKLAVTPPLMIKPWALKGYWRLSAGTSGSTDAKTIPDLSGQGNHGTASGGAWIASRLAIP